MTYRMSRETLATFRESARIRFCRKAMTALCADGHIAIENEDNLAQLLALSKQADDIGLKSQATQYSYMLLCYLVNHDSDKLAVVHDNISQIKANEEARLEALDYTIDKLLLE